MSGARWLNLVLAMDHDALIHERTREINPARRAILERLITHG